MVISFVITGVKTFVAGSCTISFLIFYKTNLKRFMSTSLLRKFYAEQPFLPKLYFTELSLVFNEKMNHNNEVKPGFFELLKGTVMQVK